MKNKEKIFEELYNKNKDKIYRLCLGFVGDPFYAEDLLQEIFLKVWKNLDKFRGESSPETWIYRIAVNTAITFKKKQAKKITTEKQIPETPSETNENKELLLQAISKLKRIDRLIIGMVLEGFSYKEIAEILGISQSNVAVKVHRIKKELKKKLNIL